jgi:DNA-binding NtrC family response regulator
MRTVLLADDNRECRRSMMRLIQRLGLRTLTAANTDEVLRALERTMIDLAILDLEMPREGGLAVLPRIRRHRPSLPVIIVSGADSREAVLRSFAAGAYGFLHKPVDVYTLRRFLRRAATPVHPALLRIGFPDRPGRHRERKNDA